MATCQLLSFNWWRETPVPLWRLSQAWGSARVQMWWYTSGGTVVHLSINIGHPITLPVHDGLAVRPYVCFMINGSRVWIPADIYYAMCHRTKHQLLCPLIWKMQGHVQMSFRQEIIFYLLNNFTYRILDKFGRFSWSKSYSVTLLSRRKNVNDR